MAGLSRRSFFALASGLLVPWEPERVYSFLPSYQLWCQETLWWAHARGNGKVVVSTDNEPGWINTDFEYFGGLQTTRRLVMAHTSDEHDIRESARIFGVPLVFA